METNYATLRVRIIRSLFALVIVGLLTASCAPGILSPANPPPPPLCEDLVEQEAHLGNLPFATLARGGAGVEVWSQGEFGLVVLDSHNEIPPIEPYLDEQGLVALPSIDFTTDLAVAMFVRTPDGGWQLCVTHVTAEVQTLVLHTHLIQSHTRADVVTSYYHLLRVPKDEVPSGDIQFQIALTRHLYVRPSPYQQQVIEATDEGIVLSVTDSIR